MALNALDIAQVLEEISPVLRGGWIQKIQQPTPHTLVFDVRVPGQTHRLLISCQPETSRLHLTSRTLLNPPTPPAFCQFLRAHFQGARIDDISRVPNDRIVELHFTGKEGTRMIVCELTGKKANVLVLDAERRVLRDLTHQRDLVGQAYAPPAGRETGLRETQLARFTGAAGGEFPISVAIEAHYQDQEATLAIDRAKDARLRVLKKTLKKEQRRIEAWRDDLAKAVKYRDYARYGELIKANLGSIKKGSDHIAILDYFDDRLPEVTIPLDTTKSAQGNMDDYFRKHRKYLAAERELKPRIERAEHDLIILRQELKAIEEGTWTPPTTGPSAPKTNAMVQAATGKALQSGDQRRGPFRRFTSTDGLPIFVGRNARENDELTFGLAKSDDLWLHARGTPGSHVVVRLEKGNDPPPETIRDAATLALLYSDLKKSGKGDVIYTRRKWVKKAKGQAPGAVIVTQEKSLHVNLDKKRLDALKARSTHK
ncbi:MAG: NFACT family protein [Nitrospirae bacterium]|nr:NFACT family protein [Nitrospirota bacterium]